MESNMTLFIDPDTRDLSFDEHGYLKTLAGSDTTAQNVRNALLTWKAEFFADSTHGTDYERILAQNFNDVDSDEIKEVIREAIFQEPAVSRIDSMEVSTEGRSVSVVFSATLVSGESISLEVSA